VFCAVNSSQLLYRGEMLEKLREIFDRAQYHLLKDDFLIIPSKELVKELKKKGWEFEVKKNTAAPRYGRPSLVHSFNVYSPDGKKLIIGETPALWHQYKNDRETALIKIYKTPYMKQKPD
jgi:hypothetical protein